MKILTPFLFVALMSVFGFQSMKAQVDLSGFDQLFETAAANTTGSSVGGGGTTTTQQGQTNDRDGGGNMDVINANWPVSGTMIIRKTKLTWGEGVQPTKITLKQGSEIIFTTPVSGNSVEVDFTSLNLKEDKSYNLQLSNDEMSSKRTKINFANQSKLQEAMQNLENDISYKKADGVKKKLMKAFFLEKNKLNYEAYEAYHITTSDPGEMNIILIFYNDFRSRT